MASVLVAHADANMRFALASLLRAEGHVVTEVGDGVLAVAALWVSHRPLVAVLGDDLAPLDAADVLELAAEGEPPLARHRYVVLTAPAPTDGATSLTSATPDRLRAALHSLRAGVATTVPTSDPDALLAALKRAERRLPSWPLAAESLTPYPERMRRLAHRADGPTHGDRGATLA